MRENSHHTAESKQKIIKNNGMRGKAPWNKGMHNHLSEAQLKRLSSSHLGKPSGNKGNHYSTASRKKISESKAGRNHPFFGKHLSEETKKRIGEKQLGKNNHMWGRRGQSSPFWGRHHSEETKQKLRENHYQPCIKPSGPELYLDSILQNHFPDEWWFVGDGEVAISGLCPDFINCNGKKQIIEVFGDYWHNRKNMKHHQTEEGRKEAYAKPGYSTLIIWEHELLDERIRLFEGNNGAKKEDHAGFQ